MISVEDAIYYEEAVERMQQYAILYARQHSTADADSNKTQRSKVGIAIFNAKSPNKNDGVGPTNR